MIADIDKNMKISVSRLFADDTKVSTKIRNQESTELLQQDLNTIYKWTDDSLMQFSESKFERMSLRMQSVLKEECIKRNQVKQ